MRLRPPIPRNYLVAARSDPEVFTHADRWIITKAIGPLTFLTHTYRIGSLLPRAAREQLYDLHPGRTRRWQRHVGIEFVTSSQQAVLTLDDGPDEDATLAVLDALDGASANATFFVLGSQVRRHVGIAHEVIRRGHEIGLHGYDHRRHDRMTRAHSRDDVLRGFCAVEDALGLRCKWYRPPYGRMSKGSGEACKTLGLTPVYWSAWGVDWENVDAVDIARVASQQLDQGVILLLHDSARYARRPSAAPTAEAIRLIAESANARGIALVSLGEAVSE